MTTAVPKLITPTGQELKGKAAVALATAIDDWSEGRSTSRQDLETLVKVLRSDPEYEGFAELFPPMLHEPNDTRRAAALKKVALMSMASGQAIVNKQKPSAV